MPDETDNVTPEPYEVTPFAGITTTDGPRKSGRMEVVDIPVDDLEPHPLNPNEETTDKFNALTEGMAEDGPDQPCVVVPIDVVDGRQRYQIIKGEHRWRAARVIGWTTFPCVVREEWRDDLTRLSRLVRDNVVRGEPNPKKLTAIVRIFRGDHQMDADMTAALMGFDSSKEMYSHMVREAKPKAIDDKAVLAKAKGEVKVLDDLATVLNLLFTRHGSTLPYGYIAFMWGGHVSYMIELTDEMKALLDNMAEIAVDRRVDLNLLLASVVKDALPAYRTAWTRVDVSVGTPDAS